MQEENPFNRTLKVIGQATVNTVPDVCWMCFSVETENKNASRAYHDNNRKINQIIEKIEQAGIGNHNIKTANFSIVPTYKMAGNSTRQTIEAYRIFHYLYVKIEELDKVSVVLDEAVAAGATGVHSINFTVKNPEKHTAEARAKALLDAKTKAEKTASALGFKLGSPLSVSDSETGQHLYRAASMQDGLAEGDMSTRSKGANLQPGETSWKYEVYVTYEIESEN
ncbi:SIMPL domain-containing protein [candidate division WOR-3 bacterium]|nr:SIMPL domain-containing protein [candidate division WOR-3 bacterium]